MTTYHQLTDDQIDAVIVQVQAARRVRTARELVRKHWENRADKVRYLKITFSSSYNDEGGNDPRYSIVALSDGSNPEDFPDTFYNGDEDDDYEPAQHAQIIEPKGYIWESDLIKQLGLEHEGGDALYDGDEEWRPLMVIDLFANAAMPALYRREEDS